MTSPLKNAVLGSLIAIASFIFALDCTTHRSAPPPSASGQPEVSPAAQEPTPTPTPPANDPTLFRTDDEKNTIAVFDKAAPATVFVTQKRRMVDFFGRVSDDIPAGSGSGFIWDKDGHVVTNFHVIQGAHALTVSTHDHQVFEAEVVGVEPRKDIAVLKLKEVPPDLTPIEVADTQELAVGQKAIAIGNPFGLDHTLTTGVISALGREVNGIGGVSIRDMVQTDAAINPGNSGGPLLNSAGALIGMNTMIYSRSGGSAGIGFAVPVAAISRVVPQLIKTGKVEQVGLGVQIDPSQRLERRARILGVVVLRVIPGSPAEKAGLKGITQTSRGIALGDVIVEINGAKIEDYDDLYNTLDTLRPGDETTVVVARNGERVTVKIPLVVLE